MSPMPPPTRSHFSSGVGLSSAQSLLQARKRCPPRRAKALRDVHPVLLICRAEFCPSCVGGVGPSSRGRLHAQAARRIDQSTAQLARHTRRHPTALLSRGLPDGSGETLGSTEHLHDVLPKYHNAHEHQKDGKAPFETGLWNVRPEPPPDEAAHDTNRRED